MKKKAHATFITTILNLTLNSTSTSSGGSCCVGTLIYLRTRYKFYQRTCPVLPKFAFKEPILVHARDRDRFSLEFSHVTMRHPILMVRTHLRRGRVGIQEPPNTDI
jgi:hypothetical protein